jgi:hypothetical protein
MFGGYSMSVLVFIDESRWDRPGTKDYFATVAGIAVEESTLQDFGHKVMGLKDHFFKKPEISDYPLRGRLLLNNRALKSYRKQEFVLDLFSLCKLHGIVTFSTTRRCSPEVRKPEFDDFLRQFQHGAISASDHFSEKEMSLLLAYLIERVNSFVLENHPGQQAKLIFRMSEARRDNILSASVMNFIYKTTLGGGFYGLLGDPLFAPSHQSAGLQIADLFAYIINQKHGGRPEMNRYFAEVESMQFVSSIEPDDFKLRGMVVIE